MPPSGSGCGYKIRPFIWKTGDPSPAHGAYSFLATVEKVLVRLLPTVVKTVTAATEIKAAMRPYSIAVAPVSFLRSLINIAGIPEPFRSN